MEEKKKNGDVLDDDQYEKFDASSDIPDDDLDLSELLEKYMLEPQESEKPAEEAEEKFDDAVLDELELIPEDKFADDVDASVYSEFASEVYSDDDARREAANAAQMLDETEFSPYDGNEGAENGVYVGKESDLPAGTVLEPYGDQAGTDGVYGEETDALDAGIGEVEPFYVPGENALDAQFSPDASLGADGQQNESGLYVDGSDYSAELADLSRFADGDGYAHEPPIAQNPEESADFVTAGDIAAQDQADESADGESESDFVDYEANEEQIDIDDNVDSTDINLMLAFGLDDELERTMGAETAKRLTKELDEEQRQRDEKVRKTVDNEYMNRSQTAGIAKEYTRRYRGIRIKLALGAIFAIVLFLYENLRMFGFEFTGALDATVYPTVYIMVSLQLLLLVAACAYEQILTGFARLFTGKPDARSVAATATLAATVYSAILPKLTVLARRPLVINFAVALMLVFTLVADFYNIRREIFTFNVVSSKRPKHIITKVSPGIADEGTAVTGDEDDQDDGDVLKFETAAFVDGYFTRTKEPTRAGKTYAVAALVIGLISAAAAGLYTHFATQSATVASLVENSFCGFFIALPVSMLIAASYPFYRASRDAYDNDGAIIGECSLEEYSNAKCVTFDDIGVFPSYGVRVQNVKIYNNHRIDRVLFYAASVFSVARGPLTDVFDMATVEIGHSDEVKIRAAGSGYLAASVDEKNITFGSAAELITRGFDIPEAVTDEDDFDEDDVSVMYMFREEKLMAKMFIKYTLDPDFESIMSSLGDESIAVSIKTYDPNIDSELIASGLKGDLREYSYSVTRYDGADDGSTIRDSVDSGIVSRSSAKTLLQLISDCTKVLASRRAGTTIGVISSIVAALLMIIVIAAGRVGSLTSGVMAIYQLFWLIPTYISAKMYVR